MSWLNYVTRIDSKKSTLAEMFALSMLLTRVKLGIFGQTAKFGQRHCLFHISNIGIKNKLTKQTVNILMRRLIKMPSHLDLHCLQMSFRIYLMFVFTRLYPSL